MSIKKSSFTVIGSSVLLSSLILSACANGDSDNGNGESDNNGADGEVTVAFVPKIQGIPFFEAMNAGGQLAESEMGNFKWLYQGPTEDDAAAQADVVRGFIQQDVDVLMVAPNDPDSIGPVLQEAVDAGIKVATADTDAPNTVREFFVEQASVEGLGTSITDALMDAMGGEGKYAIVSCTETAENLNSWIDFQKDYTASDYPNAEIVDIVYAGEDEARAVSMATDLLNAHPDLKGLVGECTPSAPAVAQAVENADKIGEVFTVGVGTPQAMKPYLENGSSEAGILWDVEQFGYLTAWAGVQLALGEDFQEVNKVNDELTEVTWDPDRKSLLLGPPLLITTENVDNFEY